MGTVQGFGGSYTQSKSHRIHPHDGLCLDCGGTRYDTHCREPVTKPIAKKFKFTGIINHYGDLISRSSKGDIGGRLITSRMLDENGIIHDYNDEITVEIVFKDAGNFLKLVNQGSQAWEEITNVRYLGLMSRNSTYF